MTASGGFYSLRFLSVSNVTITETRAPYVSRFSVRAADELAPQRLNVSASMYERDNNETNCGLALRKMTPSTEQTIITLLFEPT